MNNQRNLNTNDLEQVGDDIQALDNSLKLLLVDDDGPLRKNLEQALNQRGFAVKATHNVETALNLISQIKFDFALIDLRLEDGLGTDLQKEIYRANPLTKTVILTGYGNITAAVCAIKAGAIDFLTKPVSVDDIVRALTSVHNGLPPPLKNPVPADHVKLQHISSILQSCDYNVSETARQLNMHRRTLQRILNRSSLLKNSTVEE